MPGRSKNGETIGYDADLGNWPGALRGKTEQRVYGDARDILRNYNTVIGKERRYFKDRWRFRKKSGAWTFSLIRTKA